MKFNIGDLTNLINVGGSTVSTIMGLIHAGQITAAHDNGAALTAEEAQAHFDALVDETLKTGDDRAKAIEDQHHED